MSTLFHPAVSAFLASWSQHWLFGWLKPKQEAFLKSKSISDLFTGLQLEFERASKGEAAFQPAAWGQIRPSQYQTDPTALLVYRTKLGPPSSRRIASFCTCGQPKQIYAEKAEKKPVFGVSSVYELKPAQPQPIEATETGSCSNEILRGAR